MIILVGVSYSAMVGFFCGVFRDRETGIYFKINDRLPK